MADVSEFLFFVDSYRNEQLEALSRKYKSVGNLLRKIEEVVHGSSTGKCNDMKPYYIYWEHKIYSSIKRVRDLFACCVRLLSVMCRSVLGC